VIPLTPLTPLTPPPCRQLPLSRLGHLIPPLVDGQALVALVPLTEDLAWAAKAAWDIARIAARDGRRVALVDLHLEQPGGALHQLVGLSPTEGIVDAFEYGVSLTKAAHEVTGVFVIPSGSETASPDQVYAHPRWPKLQAGFRSEGALLLVFVSRAGLSQLSAVADGAIVLAPEGLGPRFNLGRDVPLLGVARDRWLPSGHRISSPPAAAPGIPVTPPRRRGLYAAVAALLLAGLAVGGWALLAGARESFIAPPPPPLPVRTIEPPAPPPVPLDTLGWTVQLAAYASLPKALAYADHLGESGVTGLVSPVPQKEGGPVWYRVLAGSYATRADAANARSELWRRGIAAEGIGDLLRAPYSYRAPAGVSVDSLRARGLPAVLWGVDRQVTIGAFESPEQAALTAAALKRAGVRANLLPRMGRGGP
jgi:hypothetical protein